jgi:BASS family bile acid:Na+ symporter
MMVTMARGDMAHAAAMLLLAAVGTVIMLPLAAPLMVPGLAVDAWAVAGPLVAIVLLPLTVGMVIHRYAASIAMAVRRPVKRVTAVATLLVLALCGLIYGRDFISVLGSFAIAAQVLYLGALTALSSVAAMGLPPDQRSVLGLGMSTRNVGAALAPLFAATMLDEGAIVMVVLGVPVQIAVSALAARLYRSRTPLKGHATV